MSGKLFVTGTPIGNLGDITLRAIETLREVAVVAAEDTRRSRELLSHLGISGKQLICLDAHASEATLAHLLSLLAAGTDIALLTDAGTPAVSDPGTALVARCHEAGHAVIPIPGASAVTAAVAASGLVDLGFAFLGFLPRKGEKRRRALERVARSDVAVVLFESPNRVRALFADLAALAPARRLCVARELTKKFEEIAIQTVADWAALDREYKGEITLVLAANKDAEASEQPTNAQLTELLAGLLNSGMSARDAAAELSAASGAPKREIYQMALRIKAAAGPTA